MPEVAELRQAVLDECLKASRLACAIFDATEADAITPGTARDVVSLNQTVHAIHEGLLAIVLARAGAAL